MSNGVIRRIDSLGRVVIPISIRKKLNMQIDDLVEIDVDDTKVEIRKHSSLHGSEDIFVKICSSLQSITKGTIVLFDQEKIVTSYGEEKNKYKKETIIPKQIRIKLLNKDGTFDKGIIVDDEVYYLMFPLLGEYSKVKGGLMLISNDYFIQNHRPLIKSYAIFIEEMINN